MSPLRQRQILVVDDDPIDVALLQAAFEALPVSPQLLVCKDEAVGIALLEQRQMTPVTYL